mgnify:CR=1 FL=1
MNNKEFEQMVKDASPQDLGADDLDCAIEFYRYQNRMERRYLGECIQLASRFRKYRLETIKSIELAQLAEAEALLEAENETGTETETQTEEEVTETETKE